MARSANFLLNRLTEHSETGRVMGMTKPRLDAEVEVGCMFGKVHASFVGDDYYGAHVEIDGNVIFDTRVLTCHHPLGEGWLEVRALRKIAELAVRGAWRKIGLDYDTADVIRFRCAIAKALPWPEDGVPAPGGQA